MQHCKQCRLHGVVYGVVLIAIVYAQYRFSGWSDRSFSHWLPFSGRIAHTMFVVASTAAACVAALATICVTEGLLGKHVGLAGDIANGQFDSEIYANHVAAANGSAVIGSRRLRWDARLLAIYLLAIPSLAALITYQRYPVWHFKLYVGNGHNQTIAVETPAGSLSVPAGEHRMLTLPRTRPMTLSASIDGKRVDQISIAGLEQIFRHGKFPDLEQDTGDTFFWNVSAKLCYRESTASYGRSLGFGAGPRSITDRVFYTNAKHIFESAPSSVSVPKGIPIAFATTLNVVKCK